MSSIRSIKYIKTFIDGVENDFDKVWLRLVSLRKRKKEENENIHHLITEFQVELATILFRLEKEFQFNAKVHNHMKRNRRSYRSYKEFRKLESECIKIKITLDAMIYFGRSLGDAFVWLFYHSEQDLLMKHFESQRSRMPITTGGWCELEFIKKHPVINKQIVIYHNITNILRLGDISLWGGQNAKITGIGEIKSEKKTNGEVLIQVEVLGHKKMLVPFPEKSIPKENNTSPINYANKERHDKQIKRIAGSFEHYNFPKDEKVTHRIDFESYYDKISNAVDGTTEGFTITQIDRGLILICYKTKQKSFAERLLADDSEKNEFDKLNYDIIQPIFTAPRHNYMIYKSVHFTKDMKAKFLPGMRPLFWSDINLEVLKKIYFGEVYLITIYNPGFLICAVEEMGLKLSEDRKLFTKTVDNKRFGIEGVEYFLRMIAENFHPEEAVLNIIQESVEMIDKKNFDKPTKIHFNIQFAK